MSETLMSLDKTIKPARHESPEPTKPKNPELRHLTIFLTAAIFLLALVLFIWLILSLLNSKYSLDALPIVGSGGQIKSLDL